MLSHLYIKNYALISELSIDFDNGFSVITGETGAGKSIILGALGMLLGERSSSLVIKAGEQKCIVEAEFRVDDPESTLSMLSDNDVDFDGETIVVRRELTASGKSRSFVNDTPVALAFLKSISSNLIDIHSQHQNLMLGRQNFQLWVLDAIADDGQLLKEYQASYAHYQEAERELVCLKDEIAQAGQQADFMRYQYDELSAARLVDGEQEELEQRSGMMTHAEEIKQALFEASQSIDADDSGALSLVRKAGRSLADISRLMPETAALATRLDEARIELKDICEEIDSLLANVDYDPKELQQVNERIDLIYNMQKKYRLSSVSELLALQADLQAKLNAIDNSDTLLEELTAKRDRLLAASSTLADRLSCKRATAAEAVVAEMQQRLASLGMPNAAFKVETAKGRLQESGQDEVTYLFSGNSSSPLQPVAQVASGGEIARVMLSLKAMVSAAVNLPTIIFDEIDTGVSGRMALQMARTMSEMGSNGRQVISITHLPQIAALGRHHFKVYKEDKDNVTTTHLVCLSDSERVEEIAKMLSGNDVTPEAIANAKQLLNE